MVSLRYRNKCSSRNLSKNVVDTIRTDTLCKWRFFNMQLWKCMISILVLGHLKVDAKPESFELLIGRVIYIYITRACKSHPNSTSLYNPLKILIACYFLFLLHFNLNWSLIKKLICTFSEQTKKYGKSESLMTTIKHFSLCNRKLVDSQKHIETRTYSSVMGSHGRK